MVVVDASAIVDAIYGGTERSTAVTDRLRGEPLVAPHLIDQEVMQVVRRDVVHGAMPVEHGRIAVGRFAAIRIHRLATQPILDRTWELRDTATAYDAAYLALAEALDIPLVTTDAGLGRNHRTEAVVEVIR